MFMVSRFGCRVSGFGCRDLGFVCRVWCFRFWDLGFGVWV